MKNIIKKLSLALAMTIILMNIVPQSTYASKSQTGTPSDWAKSDINRAKEINLIPNKIQGNYRENITREEFSELAVMLYEALSKKQVTQQVDNPFVDTQNPKVVIANQLGIVQGTGEGIFDPNKNITREQVSVVIYNTLKTAKPKYDYSNSYKYEFKDGNNISTWATEEIGYLYGTEVINGINENTFNPNGYTSREEAIVIAKRLYDKAVESDRASRNKITGSRSSTRRPDGSQQTKLKDLISDELGKPYKWGSSGPNSYDCSGLTYSLFGKMGIKIGRSSKDQINSGVAIAKKDLQYGDLVLFARDGKNINHVGIYVGDGKFVHSPETGDVVKTTTLMSGYYSNSYYAARRVLK